MKLWQVLFDDHAGWKNSILVMAPYPAFSDEDALDEAADSDEGQKHVMTDADLADFKTEDERDNYCMYLGNASQPFARENLNFRRVTVEEVFESGATFRPINSDAEELLKEGLKREHNDTTESRRACDICTAIENEYYLWAAHLLVSATSCPVTEAAYVWLTEGKHPDEHQKEVDEQRDEMKENVDHKTCPECNAMNWGDYLETCGNCLAVIPEEEEEEEEDPEDEE